MKTTPGQIYFLKEKDYLTGEEGPYVKIGLVRDDKETEKRIKEHQTGNPRKIYDHATLSMRFVEHAETLLHYLFGEHWVTGEWFKMTEEQIEQAIGDCERINAEQLAIEEAYLASIELKTQLSNGEVLPAQPSDKAVHEKAVQLKEELSIIGGQLTLCKNRLLRNLENANGIAGVLDVLHKEAGTSWDEAAFKTEHPALYEQYCTTSSKLTGSYSLQGVRSLKKLDEILYGQIKASNDALPKELTIDRDKVLPRTEYIETLHLSYIHLSKQLYETDWAYKQLEYQLQQRMGIHDELAGIAKWKRVEKESLKLDKEALFAEHPDMEGKYSVERAAGVAYLVRGWREY